MRRPNLARVESGRHRPSLDTLERLARALGVPVVSLLAWQAADSPGRLRIVLRDGRDIGVPLRWFPRLERASAAERRRWTLVDGGERVRWEELGEEVWVRSLLAGGESEVVQSHGPGRTR
jgi:transcriptional regulator with XRE-family HTH domain